MEVVRNIRIVVLMNQINKMGFTFPSAAAGYGLRTYLHSTKLFPHKLVERSGVLNRTILIPFLKHMNIEYHVHNRRYKGLDTADLKNSLIISNGYFFEFKKWVNDNKDKILETYDKIISNIK